MKARQIKGLSVMLIQPETPGNIGAVARAMDNFSVQDLYLCSPRCDHLSKEALDRATNSKHILENAKILDINEIEDALVSFQVVIGTSARLGTDFNVRRSPLMPEQATSRIKGSTCLVFGRESSGMRNEEIALCDFIVTIPSSRDCPSLNLSHSVAVLLYAINSDSSSVENNYPLVGSREKHELFRLIEKRLDNTHFPTSDKRETQKIVWRHVLGKSALTQREASALLGFFRRLG